MGYKKASVADIAEKAGVTKGMITYYFGSKKNLYIYLSQISSETIMSAIEKHIDPNIDDYFEKFKMISKIKLDILEKYPNMNNFLVALYAEKDKEVEEVVNNFVNQGLENRQAYLLENVDKTKFKEEANLDFLSNLIRWTTKGMVEELVATKQDSAKYTQFFWDYLDILKKTFYKEEYL